MSVDLDFALRRKEPFSRIHDMIAFMAALDNAPPAVINEFLMLFTREPHITDKLTCILELRFTPSTFQQVAKPLLALLASTTLVHSPHASDVRALLRLVWSCPLFFKRTMDFLNDPQLLSDVKHDSAPHFAALLLLLVKKLPSVVPLDDMCYDLLGRFRDWGHQNLPTTSGVVAMLNEAMELCEEFVPSRAPHDKVAPAAPNYFVDMTPRPVRRFVEDGDTAIGPRHDNDKPNVDDIQVLPTDDEMRCAEEPYLPLHPDSPSDAGAHVSFHFRAMREDALAQMRRGLQWWLHPSTDRFVPPPRHSDKPRLNVAVQVSLRQVHGSIHKGVLFQVRGPQPWPHETKANLTALWERDRRYAVGSLVCIATEVTMSPEPDAEPGGDAFPRRAPLACHSLVFGTVAVRDTALLVDPDGFCISIKLIRPTEVPRIMRAMSHGLNVLLEVQNSFFTGYEPILRSLQAHDVAPRLRECLYGTDPAATWTQRPAYLTRTHLQLQCLVHPDHQHDVNLRQVPAASKDGLAAQLRAVMDKLVLDASQIDAFAAAMTQQMCLIQGPPGTGKSYVGTRIVDGILAQTGVTVGPILVVCYTNHALDQFLEGLLDDHIARPLDIVRVGSRSKSARLDECTLFHLRKMEHFAGPTRLESATHGKLVRTCRDIEERTFSSFHQDTALAKFLQWLAQSKTESFEGICGPVDDEDGFHVQGGHKAQEKLFKKWEQGGKGWSSTMWKMNKPGRQALLRRWRHEFVETCSRRTLQDFDVYQECVTKAAEIQTAQNLRLLGRAKIVGMTTTGCALNQELVRCLAPKVVLCEEAGEVLEAHLLSCLTAATEHVIQIGDHKQLRPLVSEFKLSIDANNGFNLDVSMFERLVQTEAPVVTLNTQRRMSRDVCDLIRWTIYPTLEDAPNVLQYPAVLRGFSHSLWFLDHSFQESDKDGSKTNADEASMVVELVQYALRQGFCDVAVLTPYLGQLVVLRNELNTKHVWTELGEKDEEDVLALDTPTHSVGDDTKLPYRMAMKSLKNCVKLATVDNFQGNEAELVIVSTVRSNARGSVGFLKILNRVNVMLSRAKHGRPHEQHHISWGIY
ncbi:hypothetical protein DYB36_003712 [Aphanomyces astaci]|uniref:AAA+ ATPase domain-containing protein n=1 Tax=Aphanomyces astaci TaxID=112090 RepID=A0A397B3E0_APHAT|nr:hypothetical protein DYB36_003712 [Aphanomyces astaci]